jgi:hypothetical protein
MSESISEYFYKKYKQIKEIPQTKKMKVKKETEKNKIIRIVKKHFSNIKMIEYLDDQNLSLVKFENKKLLFYVFYKNNFEFFHKTCIELICICNYFHDWNNGKKINLIWIPLPICRDFYHDKSFQTIESSINHSEKNFQAFSVSGKTFSNFMNNGSFCSIITRLEEIHKLCIHELLHQTKLDYSDSMKQNTLFYIYEEIKPICNHHYKYSLLESYTELSSTYHNIIFQLYFIFGNKISLKKFNKLFIFCICLEMMYSTLIVLSLIKMNNYKNVSEFNKRRCFVGNINMSVYEYYYIKWLLFFLFDFTDENNIYGRIYKIHFIPKCMLNILEKIYLNVKIFKNYKYIYCTKENLSNIF